MSAAAYEGTVVVYRDGQVASFGICEGLVLGHRHPTTTMSSEIYVKVLCTK